MTNKNDVEMSDLLLESKNDGTVLLETKVEAPVFASSHFLLLSHALNRTGDKMWEFLLPLVLTEIFQNLRPPALIALAGFVTGFLFAPLIGRFVDTHDRFLVVLRATTIQALAIFAATIVLIAALLLELQSEWILLALVPCAIFATLGLNTMDISIEKDWVPTTVLDDTELTVLNSQMRRIDLITELGGPVIVGVLISIQPIPVWVVVLVVGLFNSVSFCGELAILRHLYLTVPELRKKNLESERTGSSSPLANLTRSLSAAVQQPPVLVIVAYACLWLNVLSPHGALLTAFLVTQGFENEGWALAIFRGLGAVMGVLSTWAFPLCLRFVSLQQASFLFIAAQCVFMIASAAAFFFLWPSVGGKVLFLAGIVLSRVGLYGFCLGELQLVQDGTPEELRGQVGAVETMLTNLGTFAVYSLAIFLSKPEDFAVFVAVATAGCCAGLLAYAAWWSIWLVHPGAHTHDAYHLEHHSHAVSPGSEGAGKHVHYHYHLRRRVPDHTHDDSLLSTSS
mmetsp:Transcript_28753/g.72335  ORF Transcript_28753/g.72335 Transcript_28753/m.72335 type:complete len:510 (-) Transcript_28753:831-2360(-)